MSAAWYWCAIHLLFLGILQRNRVDGLGVNWGTMATHKLPPKTVVQMMKDNGIQRVKLFYADQSTMDALAGFGIEVMVAIPNDQLQVMTSYDRAKQWVRRNITRYNYNEGVKIKSGGSGFCLALSSDGNGGILVARAELHMKQARGEGASSWICCHGGERHRRRGSFDDSIGGPRRTSDGFVFSRSDMGDSAELTRDPALQLGQAPGVEAQLPPLTWIDAAAVHSSSSDSGHRNITDKQHTFIRHVAADLLLLATDVTGIPSPAFKIASFFHKTGLRLDTDLGCSWLWAAEVRMVGVGGDSGGGGWGFFFLSFYGDGLI
ncbi:hypothetical protein RJ640_006158 [Escallonia rubra]|uniref:Glucan endo-1,3-beta-D-glucosidase n=1 Tax=Escallonia rubra TaxID=112253 RepID=A0AA88USG5_9ASTE|nr:hypothetical protein RJ640_006158 [Escallonia rubra]